MGRKNTRMYGPNKFKLGLFGQNCSGGLSMSKVPERWDPSWDNNLEATKLADDAGLEFILPIGRWQGYKGETDTEGTTFETLTWASGLLAATKNICVFGTVHVGFLSPIFAAKQMVTADHIGKGRFGLNMVSGWNAGEHSMFGVELRPQEERYDYTEEWVTILKRVWSEDKPFDFKGKYFNLQGVLLKPKPWGDDRPILVSAGNSAAGKAFAARHADCLFTSIIEFEKFGPSVRALRASSKTKNVGIFASGHMVTKPTTKEAKDYYHYLVYEMGDWDAAEHAVAIRTRGRDTPLKQLTTLTERMISGVGTYPIVGSYDDVVEQCRKMSQYGVDGIAIGLVNYITDFPILRDEILPRMERLGLRLPISEC
ncbi:MAG: LLM class flavin-dependent oxidoreductase [Rhodospirillaceae bacterium]|jgi:FMNH2-dependent dimethyl sulfone monooxygenase|nr:LLM class flavin-dependent oxidoreductase [Rhodospirillaceae bacterium]